MKITDMFTIRLATMKEPKRSDFLRDNQQAIDFTRLMLKAKDQLSKAIALDSEINQQSMTKLIEDITLYEAKQRLPAAVSNIEVVVNPTPLMTVM